MSGELGEALKKNWYLLAGCGLLMVGGIVMSLRGGEEPVTEEPKPGVAGAGELNPDSPTGEAADDGFVSSTGVSDENRENKMRLAAERMEKDLLEMDPDDEKYVTALARVANTYYEQLKDYEKAAEYYSELIEDHPDTPNARARWESLANCYRQLGELSAENQVYEGIIKNFPEDSPEYGRAKKHLESVGLL